MAQIDLTLSIDSRRQQQINRYCALSGLSRKAALDEIMNMWEKLVYIPQMDYIEKEARRRKAREAFFAMPGKGGGASGPDPRGQLPGYPRGGEGGGHRRHAAAL